MICDFINCPSKPQSFLLNLPLSSGQLLFDPWLLLMRMLSKRGFNHFSNTWQPSGAGNHLRVISHTWGSPAKLALCMGGVPCDLFTQGVSVSSSVWLATLMDALGSPAPGRVPFRIDKVIHMRMPITARGCHLRPLICPQVQENATDAQLCPVTSETASSCPFVWSHSEPIIVRISWASLQPLSTGLKLWNTVLGKVTCSLVTSMCALHPCTCRIFTTIFSRSFQPRTKNSHKPTDTHDNSSPSFPPANWKHSD